MASAVASINLNIWRLLVAVTVLAALFVLKDLILPVAIAALITFLLSPVANRLQPTVGRIAAVLISAGVAFGLIGLFLWLTVSQLLDLAWKLPTYQDNLRAKVADLSISGGGPFAGLSQMLENLATAAPAEGESNQLGGSEDAFANPVPVAVVELSSNSQLAMLKAALEPLLRFIGPAGAVVILCLFMLTKRDDLRDRLIGLIGRGRINKTTVAMREAARRVTSYLRSQLIVNVTYGIPVAIGLYFIGIPNAILWGLLATVLRFIPYAGPLIAMLMPISLSLAVFDSWTPPLLTIGLFVFLEIVSNNFIEPWLYGASTGISSFALIVASLFWIWLWGIPGLVLSTPLTVCLLVMGRHVPHLSFITTLLSDQKSLSSAETAYQRLISRDQSAFREVVKTGHAAHGLENVIAETLLPTLAMLEQDFRSDLLDRETHAQSIEEMREAFEALALLPGKQDGAIGDRGDPSVAVRVACVPADNLVDEGGSIMLAQALRARGFEVLSLSSQLLVSELCARMKTDVPAFVWICAVNPSGLARTRVLLKDLEEHTTDLRFGLALFHPTDDVRELLRSVELPHLECALSSFDDVLLRTETLRAAVSDEYLPAPIPDTEAERLKELLKLQVGRDPLDEELFTRVTSELTRIFEVPIALVSLINTDSQIFAGQCGLPRDLAEAGRTPRSVSVCGHVAAGNAPFIIPDLLQDPRFAGNPLIKERQLRFYAGVPLRTSAGHAIGSLCIIDHRPRTISKREVRLLQVMAENLMADLETRAEASSAS